MLVTVIADASYDRERQLATYAFFVKTAGEYPIYRSGAVRRPVLDSITAETVACVNALAFAAVQYPAHSANDTYIIQNDCAAALRLVADGLLKPRSPYHVALQRIRPGVLDARFINQNRGSQKGKYVYRKLDTLAYEELLRARKEPQNFLPGAEPHLHCAFDRSVVRFRHRQTY